MSWPPSSGFIASGGTNLPTTIAWGTEGLYVGVIVKSIRESEIAEEIPIPNGTGLTSKLVLLRDGYQYELTVEDDRNVVYPVVGANITLLEPITSNGTVSSGANFIVVNSDYNAARKQNGERVIMAKKFTLGIPN